MGLRISDVYEILTRNASGSHTHKDEVSSYFNKGCVNGSSGRVMRLITSLKITLRLLKITVK